MNNTKPLTTAPLEREEEIARRRHTVRKRGLDTAWTNANEFISLKKGYPLMIAGLGGVGKTELELDIAINASIMHGWVWLILSPEMGDKDEIIEQILEKISKGEVLEIPNESKGESVDAARPPMTNEKYRKLIAWVHKHFRILDPMANWDANFSNMALDLHNFFNEVDIEEDRLGGKFDGIIIDPFNELDIELNAMSVKDELNVLLAWTKKKNYFTILANHTTGNEKEILHKPKGGMGYYWKVPAKKEDWAYGQQFARKGYQMILMYEPHHMKQIDEANTTEDHEAQHSAHYGFNMREIFVQKSKPKGVGKTGKFRLFFNKSNQRYYCIDKLGNKSEVLWPG